MADTGLFGSNLWLLAWALDHGDDRVVLNMDWSHCRPSHGEAWTLPGAGIPEPTAKGHKPPLQRATRNPLGGRTRLGESQATFSSGELLRVPVQGAIGEFLAENLELAMPPPRLSDG